MKIYPLWKMKIYPLLAVIFSLILFLLTSCENDTGEQSNFQVTKDTSFLDESNYVFKNITTTKNLNFVDKKSKIDKSISIKYSDSTFKKPLKLFSKNQCALLLAPFLPADYGINYAVNEMWGHFVSKQNKIGTLQPIVVSVGAVHDYSALRLIVLDKNGKAISSFDLDEPVSFPQNNAPIDHYESESYSVLDKNEIMSYRMSKFYYQKKSSIKSVVIDSAVFKSIIDARGKISTKQIVKSHHTREIKSGTT